MQYVTTYRIKFNNLEQYLVTYYTDYLNLMLFLTRNGIKFKKYNGFMMGDGRNVITFLQ